MKLSEVVPEDKDSGDKADGEAETLEEGSNKVMKGP